MTLVYQLLQWAVRVRNGRINAPSEIKGKCTNRLSASYSSPQAFIYGKLYTDILDNIQHHEYISETVHNAFVDVVDAPLKK